MGDWKLQEYANMDDWKLKEYANMGENWRRKTKPDNQLLSCHISVLSSFNQYPFQIICFRRFVKENRDVFVKRHREKC